MARFSPSRADGRGRLDFGRELAVAIATILGIAWVVTISERQASFDDGLALSSIVKTNEARVQGFEQFVLRTIETADLATRHIEANLAEDGQRLISLSEDPVLASPVFEGFVVRLAGKKADVAGTSPLDLSIVPQLDEVAKRSSGELSVPPPIDSGGKRYVAVIRQFRGGAGYVAVLMEPERFTDFAQDIPFGRDDLISLIGLDGITRARRTGNALTSGEPVTGLVMDRQRADPNGTYVGPSVLDGLPRIFSHRRLSQYGLFATSGTPMTVVEARVAPRRRFQYFITLAGVALIGAAGVGIIIANERRRARLTELEDSNSRLIEAQRIGAIGDWDYYPATDQLYWSDNLQAMYGRSEEVSSIGDVSQHVSPEDSEKIREQVDRVFKLGETGTWEIEAILADGSVSSRRVVAVPILDRNGAIVGIHGTDQDITHQVQARKMEARLSEVARLESVNSLAATLAHELNQPLGITANYLGAAQKILEEGGSTSKVSGFLSACRDQIHHLAAIIDGARDLVNPGKFALQEVSLSEVVSSVMALLRGHVDNRSVNYSVEIARNLTTLWTNGAQLKQVLFNLAKNGIEAVPEGREPVLSFRIRRIAKSGAVRFEVSDNGTGMAAGVDPFDALVTTKATGLGLGLSLARTIVEAHGGKIGVYRTGPKGTTVAFTIPEGAKDPIRNET